MAKLQWTITDADLRRLIEQIDCAKGFTPEAARDHVIIEWLGHGDVRPFIEANNAGHICGVVVQNVIALMLLDGRLQVGRAKGGQSKPGAVWQAVVVEQIYRGELARLGNSIDALEATKALLGMSVSAIKNCVSKIEKIRAKARDSQDI